MKTETAQIGQGIYTAADAARILGIPYSKANYWFKYYAKNKFESLGHRYYFEVKDIIAVNFLTLIEMGVFYNMKDKKVSTNKIIEAHETIGKQFKTPYPFAYQNFFTDGKNLFFGEEDALTTANKKLQTTFSEFIHSYIEKIEFGEGKLAHKFYPLGKKRTIVVNPENQFGQPIIDGTNILAATLYDLHLGGDKEEFIAELYDIPIKSVRDAIEFSKAA
jgi:uncharacterized protein (DUF433 family)